MRLAFLVVLLISAAIVAAGQQIPRFEVFGGYAYQRFDSQSLGYSTNSNLNGWNAEGAFNATHRLAIVADLSGDYGSQLTIYNFLAGPQLSWRGEKHKFFIHGLFGKAQNTVNIQTSLKNGFESVGRAYGGGGGFDYYWRPRITIRVFQADYINSNTFGVTQNNVRISTGVVINIGKFGRRPRL